MRSEAECVIKQAGVEAIGPLAASAAHQGVGNPSKAARNWIGCSFDVDIVFWKILAHSIQEMHIAIVISQAFYRACLPRCP